MTVLAGRSPAELAAERIARDDLSPADRRRALAALGDQRRNWRFWARPNQLEPEGDWHIWAIIAGRGAGKTRSGAEYVIDRSRQYHARRIPHRAGLVGRTAADVRDTMVGGQSGIMACLDRRKIRGRHEPSRRRIVIPSLDTIIHTYSAMEPDSLRGPEHHTLWADEPGAWRHIVDAQGNTAWSNAMFGLRLDAEGLIPRVVATTTPKPIPLIKEWFRAVTPCGRPQGHTGEHETKPLDIDPPGPACGWTNPGVVMTRGALYDNISHLAPTFVAQVVERYRNSPLGAQEIFGRLVLDVEGALWTAARIEAGRRNQAPELGYQIVAVDPPAGHIAECGIIGLGLAAHPERRERPEVYVVEDASMRGRADAWGAQVIATFHKMAAHAVVVENNQGGDMVRATIQLQDPNVPVVTVTAKSSKWERAEPVAAAYDRVHHVGYFADLESQMTTWTADETYSPDRMDALVHGVRHLLPQIVAPPIQPATPADLPSLNSPLGGARGS